MARRSYKRSDNGIVITLDNPLCFTGVGTGTNTVGMTSHMSLNVKLYYSYDNITYYEWRTTINGSNYVFNTINLSYGQNLYVFGENTRMGNFISGQYRASTFTMSGRIAASGNIQSLLNSSIPTTLTTYSYYKLFQNCASLTTAPSLPAETLATYCYDDMFYGCTSLATAPSLPAETLATYCYSRMFYGCTSLTTAPSLPAQTLANNCYQYMFYGCSSLTSAPSLPAQTLANNCYQYMFRSCIHLTEVTIGATSWNTTYANNWLNGVSATGIIYKPSALVNIPTNSVSGVPTGWSTIDV